jgi:hypothetical protein
MTPRQDFHPLQADEIARAFRTESVDYLFIGKSGAILLGYPGTTQRMPKRLDRTAALRELPAGV